MPAHEVFSVGATPLLVHPAGPPILLTDLLPAAADAPVALSPLALVAHRSRLGKMCPGCGGQKWSEGIFCESCRAAVPHAGWRDYVDPTADPEGYARWWVRACADLRGE